MKSLAIAFLLSFTTAAGPAPLTVNFEDQPVARMPGNFSIGAVNFSPWCDVKLAPNAGHAGGVYLQADRENNCSGGGNASYVGATWSDVWIDMGGAAFSLLQLQAVSPFGSLMGFEVLSSAGGFFSGADGVFDFSGELWTDVLWIALRDVSDLTFHEHHGWDNLLLDVPQFARAAMVPEPSALLLVILAALLLPRRKPA